MGYGGGDFCKSPTYRDTCEESSIPQPLYTQGLLILQAVNFQLTSLQQLLASHCAEGGSQCLDLDLPGLPLKPTLQGWLLGYPVVYLCTEDTVPQISRFLSAEQLVLFTMVAGCPLLQVRHCRSLLSIRL